MSAQVKDKEAFQRLSFLYQAAHCVLAHNPENQELVRFYCHAQRSISRRLVLRQDPSVKRTICKSCSSLLVPGVSSTVRQRRRRGRRWSVVRCLCCGQTKCFPSNPAYKLWAEQPEALLENQPQADQKPAAPQDPPKEPSAQKAKTPSVTSGLQSRPTPQGTTEAGTRVGERGPKQEVTPGDGREQGPVAWGLIPVGGGKDRPGAGFRRLCS